MGRTGFTLATAVGRLLTSAIFLAVPLATAVICAGAFVKGRQSQTLHLFGRHIAGGSTPQLNCQLLDGGIVFVYINGWRGTPPARGGLVYLPGFIVNRSVVTLTNQARGDTILDVRMQWWLVLVGNLPPLALAYLLARPLLTRARLGPGRCPACGYDLRATPERCPECGEIPGPAPRTAA